MSIQNLLLFASLSLIADLTKAQSILPLSLSEVMGDNATILTDSYGKSSDWIELYNSSNEAISLKNYALSDDSENMIKWEFPDQLIPGNSYVIVYASKEVSIGDELHTNFKISSSGEAVFLSYNEELIDSIPSVSLNQDQSLIKVDGKWETSIIPSPGRTNISPASDFISITEIMGDNDTTLLDAHGKSSDWIEIYNSSPDSLSLLGFHLTDDTSLINKWSFPDVSLAGGAYLIVYASNKESINGEIHSNFKISSSGEPIALSYENTIIEIVPSTGLAADQSLAKIKGVWQKSIASSPGKKNTIQNNLIQFSKPAGLYSSKFYLTLSDSIANRMIRYTIDGSTPSSSSLVYSAPLLIDDLTSNPNGIADIPTTVDWEAPKAPLLKGTVIKAALFEDNRKIGPTITKTYLINDEFPNKYGFPVVSISIDADSLFDDDNGIMVLGPDASTRYPHMRANFWKGIERACYVEFFEDDGTLAFDQTLALKIHGGYSKGYAQKSLRLTARDELGSNRIYHQIFPDREQVEFKSIILRNSGQDVKRSLFRDALAQDVNQTEHLEMQAYRPSIVFINGVYWGIHNLRERLDDNHYSIKHKVSKKSIDHLEINGIVVDGDSSDYMAMISFIETNDLSLQMNFDTLAAQMDIKQFTDYMIAQIYVNNVDWPHGNIKYWRSSELDNKWRWSLYDLDPGMGGWAGRAEKNNLVRALSEDGNGHGAWATLILRSLMKNEEYKIFFINRFLDRLNTGLKEAVVINRVEEYRARITSLMADHCDRWPTTMPSTKGWYYGVNPIRTFGENRPVYQRQHLIDYFELPDTTYNLTVINKDMNMGAVKLNTVNLDSMYLTGTYLEEPPRILTVAEKSPIEDSIHFTGIYLQDIPLTIEALPKPGYRFSHWKENSSTELKQMVNLLSDSTFTPVFLKVEEIDHSSITINEVYNGDEDTLIGTVDSHEWIELYNSSAIDVDLSGLYLSDNENLTRWQFPSSSSSIIKANSFLIVYGDEDPTHTELLEANFNKIKTGDIISLSKIVGVDTTILSRIETPTGMQALGRIPDGSDSTTLFKYHTFNSTNTLFLDCNGEEKGLARVDDCDVCSGGTTGIEINNCITDIETNTTRDQIDYYPNPVESILHISNIVEWSLFSVNGLKISSDRSNRIDMTLLPKGAYFIKTSKGLRKVIKI